MTAFPETLVAAISVKTVFKALEAALTQAWVVREASRAQVEQPLLEALAVQGVRATCIHGIWAQKSGGTTDTPGVETMVVTEELDLPVEMGPGEAILALVLQSLVEAGVVAVEVVEVVAVVAAGAAVPVAEVVAAMGETPAIMAKKEDGVEGDPLMAGLAEMEAREVRVVQVELGEEQLISSRQVEWSLPGHSERKGRRASVVNRGIVGKTVQMVDWVKAEEPGIGNA